MDKQIVEYNILRNKYLTFRDKILNILNEYTEQIFEWDTEELDKEQLNDEQYISQEYSLLQKVFEWRRNLLFDIIMDIEKLCENT